MYRAHVENGRLIGVLDVEGKPPVQFYGSRAPKFRRDDPEKLKAGTPVELFNGRDMTGWHAVRQNAPNLWKVENGVLKNGPKTTDIATDAKFMDFRLHAEYRVGPQSNSGIALRGRYEVQILDDYGKEPNTHGAAALYSRIAPSVNASRKPGEWQSYDIRLVGRTLTVVHNGVKVLDHVQVDGLTAIANNADEAEPGPFIVQGDHSYVEIKSFVVTPLVKK